MTGDDYRESLRACRPVVYVDGRRVESVADEPALRPGVNALAFTYDYALKPELAPLALATQSGRNRIVARMLHVDESSGDLLNKLEAVRVLCQETGCAQRYLAHDALNGIAQVAATELIKITEGFFACGVAASVSDGGGRAAMPAARSRGRRSWSRCPAAVHPAPREREGRHAIACAARIGRGLGAEAP